MASADEKKSSDNQRRRKEKRKEIKRWPASTKRKTRRNRANIDKKKNVRKSRGAVSKASGANAPGVNASAVNTPDVGATIYDTRNRLGSAFRVRIVDQIADIFLLVPWDDDISRFREEWKEDGQMSCARYRAFALTTLQCRRVLLGESPYMELTSEYQNEDETHTGNSILVERIDGRYTLISDQIITFNAWRPIDRLVSPVWTGGEPCPFAIDSAQNIYLLAIGVVLDGTKYDRDDMSDILGQLDPEEYYGRRRDLHYTLEFERFTLDGEPWHPLYTPRPHFSERSVFSIECRGENPRPLSANQVEDLIRRHGESEGFVALERTQLDAWLDD
jgi:hypothetical protein